MVIAVGVAAVSAGTEAGGSCLRRGRRIWRSWRWGGFGSRGGLES